MGRFIRKLRAAFGRMRNRIHRGANWVTSHRGEIERRYQQGKQGLVKFGDTAQRIGGALGGKAGGLATKLGQAAQQTERRIQGAEDKARAVYHAAGGR